MTHNRYQGHENSQLENAWGVKMELRAKMAWELISRHTFVTVRQKNVEEGKDGNALILEAPEDVVARAFKMADVFVKTAEERGELKEGMTIEEEAVRIGMLQSIRDSGTRIFGTYGVYSDRDNKSAVAVIKNFAPSILDRFMSRIEGTVQMIKDKAKTSDDTVY